jgi:hypothetical protein
MEMTGGGKKQKMHRLKSGVEAMEAKSIDGKMATEENEGGSHGFW